MRTIFFDIETISDWIILDKYKDKYWEKINFMPEFNKILTICVWYIQDWYNVKNLEWTEKEQIEEFFRIVNGKNLCWFNIKNFDIPFILKRALYYWIKIPKDLSIYWKKPWEINNIIDLKDVYWYWVFWNNWNLDLVCNFLWITSPKSWNIDWSEVQDFYDEWKIDEIVDYCKKDVIATMELYEFFIKYWLI